jgi:uncharacterized damage-inducible protein DinB
MTNKDFFIKEWTSEIKATATSFRTVPEAKWDYKPNVKNRSAKELVAHVLGEVNDLINMLTTGTITDHKAATITTMEEAATTFETRSKEFLDKLAKTDDSTWMTKNIPFIMRGKMIYEGPMGEMAWGYFKDLIHHRGQLSTYFRPMGVVNPSIYGPTAETMEAMMAASN